MLHFIEAKSLSNNNIISRTACYDEEVRVDEKNDSVSQFEIREDLQEFISRLKNGDYFADTPYILSAHEHEMVSSVLKAKLITLKHELEISKLTILHL